MRCSSFELFGRLISSNFPPPFARFPAQDQVSGSSKIPTIIYYDTSGRARAMGAEAMQEGIYETAEDEDWIKAEWYG